jgi:cytochrome c oxidase subunit 4
MKRNAPTELRRAGLRILAAWIALLALLLLSLGSAYLKLGSGNLAVSLIIAALKTVAVIWIFMRVANSPRTVRLVIVAGVGVLALLAGLGSIDFQTRSNQPSAWQTPLQVRPLNDKPATPAP